MGTPVPDLPTRSHRAEANDDGHIIVRTSNHAASRDNVARMSAAHGHVDHAVPLQIL
jgi:hypothetical protein